MDTNLVWLGEATCQQYALVGNKAANLSQLASRYCVPPGFCLTTAAFAGAGYNQDAGAGQPLSPSLQTLLAAAYQELAVRCQQLCPAVAVRSSAVGEDGKEASFAGQYESYLNVVGKTALQKAVARCWDSARNARVDLYRQRQNQAMTPVQLAVLVQQMVAADISVVAFSAHPVTGSRNEIVINATWGLGESLVSGTVTPDTYIVSKADLSLLQCMPAEKCTMTVMADEGVREAPIPRPMQRKASLRESQATEVAQLACSLEEAMGWPVDIECAYQGGQLYLLQCRPITTLNM